MDRAQDKDFEQEDAKSSKQVQSSLEIEERNSASHQKNPFKTTLTATVPPLAEKKTKDNRLAALRRGGSRILRKLGLSSVGLSSSAKIPGTVSELGSTLPAHEPAVASGQEALPPIVIPKNRAPLLPEAQDPLSDDGIPSCGEDDDRITVLEVPQRTKSRSLRGSKSMPGMAQQLSYKISSTFGNPTVVHRPNLHQRPSIASFHYDITKQVIADLDRKRSMDMLSSPVSFTSGSQSPGDGSTPKTSLESKFNLQHNSTKVKGRSDVGKTTSPTQLREGASSAKTLTPIHETPLLLQPSIKTVESTATAKIFFEMHFNTLLSGEATPRILRRQDLEVKLHSKPFSPTQRRRERRLWADQESQYLRQYRVLKTASSRATNKKGVTVAGFEVIRVLGKGSFGVVRLVREKKTRAQQSSSSDSSEMTPESSDGFKKTLDLFRPRRSGRSKEVFAMKVIRKSEMLRNSQEGHLRAERDFLVASEKSRWVVPLVASFQDNANLYLVMEYMIGGDFLGLLIEKNVLKEKVARFYVAEMVLCLEEAHRLKWIHRDVKPDNFLISASGHLKISDFGLAFDGHWSHNQAFYNDHRHSILEKLGVPLEGDFLDKLESTRDTAMKKLGGILLTGRERQALERRKEEFNVDDGEGLIEWRNRCGTRRFAKSVVGTSQYMAPEIIYNEEYDGRCDWWSLGIILYECLYGETPFVDADRQTTKENIKKHKELLRRIPNKDCQLELRASRESEDLIRKLLREKERRLCCAQYKQNDHWNGKRSYIRRSGSSDRNVIDYQGNFVYPNDAVDIKAHPFFRGIDWEHLHLERPPEVPKVKNHADTKYFDREPTVSDIDEESSTLSDDESQIINQEAYEAEVVRIFEQEEAKARAQGNMNHIKTVDTIAKIARQNLETQEAKKDNNDGKKLKEKKRPRDKILRDKNFAKEALEQRKKGAFIGYTYRRPRAIMARIDNMKPDTEGEEKEKDIKPKRRIGLWSID